MIKSNFTRTKQMLLFAMLLFTTLLSAQRTISGKVIAGDDNTGLVGATVVVKGTTVGTSSDVDGNFTLSVASDVTTLVISSVGFLTREIDITNADNVEITLPVDVATLDEIVVTGYGTQIKRAITGAVSSVDTKTIQAVPATNVAQAIQGRVAGVNIGNENAPGGNVSVRIRGFGNINDNSPLFIVDGTPTKGNLNTLNLNDIENMQVLKDASAASIYGSRAANGVIIITTKKGKNGKPKLSYDTYYGVQTANKFLDLINPQEYVNLLWESRINAENPSLLVDGKISDPSKIVYPNIPLFGGRVATPILPDYLFPVGAVGTVDESKYSVVPKNLITKANKQGTDWFDEMFETAPITNHQLSLTGGNDAARYAMSVNYFEQNGIMKYTSYNRYSLRANTEFNATKKIRIGENFQAAFGNQVGQPNGNQSESNPISFAYRVPSIVPVYDIRGYFAGSPTVLDNSRSPIAELYRNKDNKNKEVRLFGNVY